jgi:hypothetical protein
VSQPAVAEHLKIRSQAGFFTSKRIKKWTFYKRSEKAIKAVKRAIPDAISIRHPTECAAQATGGSTGRNIVTNDTINEASCGVQTTLADVNDTIVHNTLLNVTTSGPCN